MNYASLAKTNKISNQSMVGFAELTGSVGFAGLTGSVGFAGLKVPHSLLREEAILTF